MHAAVVEEVERGEERAREEVGECQEEVLGRGRESAEDVGVGRCGGGVLLVQGAEEGVEEVAGGGERHGSGGWWRWQ